MNTDLDGKSIKAALAGVAGPDDHVGWVLAQPSPLAFGGRRHLLLAGEVGDLLQGFPAACASQAIARLLARCEDKLLENGYALSSVNRGGYLGGLVVAEDQETADFLAPDIQAYFDDLDSQERSEAA